MRYVALSRRRLLRLAVLAAGAMALGGCRESERTAPGPAGAAPSVEGPRKLRFGFSGVFDITKLPYPIALARLRAQGYEFETVFLDSAVVTFKALIAGELDLGEGAVGAAIQANQAAGGGDRLRVFCSMNPLTDYVIVTVPEITSLEGLVGRRFGVARLGAISHFVPRVVLQRSGINPDAVEWIAVGGTAARRAALYSGAIAGGVMHIEEALLAQRDGFNIIFEAAKVMPEYIANGLVAKDSFIRAYPGLIQQITNAMIDAARWVQDNREGAIAFAQQELGSEADLTLLGAAYDTMARIRGWGVNGGLTPENMTATMLEELEMKTIEQPMPWEEWATLEFINRYLAEHGLYRS
jgi:NitT/TauT family transport system substrate-binding protein